ncbi:hypothetical protein DO72_2046 [Burkholderia pseudomallei]|nr:hypothetical protein DO72_2046 [Burkholderia pseudomallei]
MPRLNAREKNGESLKPKRSAISVSSPSVPANLPTPTPRTPPPGSARDVAPSSCKRRCNGRNLAFNVFVISSGTEGTMRGAAYPSWRIRPPPAPGRSRRAFPNRRQIGPRIDTLHADRVGPLQRPPQQRARKRSGSSAPNAARGATHAAGHTITILHNPRHHISPYGMYHCAPYAPHSETWPSDVREGIS